MLLLISCAYKNGLSQAPRLRVWLIFTCWPGLRVLLWSNRSWEVGDGPHTQPWVPKEVFCKSSAILCSPLQPSAQDKGLGLALFHWLLCKSKHSLSFSTYNTRTNNLCPPPAFQRPGRLTKCRLENLENSCRYKSKPSAAGEGWFSFLHQRSLFFCYRSNSGSPEFTTGWKKVPVILLLYNPETYGT